MGFFRSKNNHKQEERTDEYLLERYRTTGDSKYFGELYDQYIPLMYGVCLKYLQNEDQAEDAVMDIFENLFHRVLKYEIVQFRPWLYNVTKNHCLKELKSNKRQLSIDSDSLYIEFDQYFMHPTEDADQNYKQALEYCLAKLPENQQVAIDLFFKEGQSYLDIAQTLSLDEKTVKSHLQNGKRNLKNCIEKRLKNEVS